MTAQSNDFLKDLKAGLCKGLVTLAFTALLVISTLLQYSICGHENCTGFILNRSKWWTFITYIFVQNLNLHKDTKEPILSVEQFVAIFLVLLVLGFLLECRIGPWKIMLVIIVSAIFGALGHICLHPNGLRGTSAVFWGFGGAFLMVCIGDCWKKRSTQLKHLFPAIFAIYFATEVMQACDAVKWTSHASHFSGLLGGILVQLLISFFVNYRGIAHRIRNFL
jgi:membrane associated rhomboid family serine protease